MKSFFSGLGALTDWESWNWVDSELPYIREKSMGLLPSSGNALGEMDVEYWEDNPANSSMFGVMAISWKEVDKNSSDWSFPRSSDPESKKFELPKGFQSIRNQYSITFFVLVIFTPHLNFRSTRLFRNGFTRFWSFVRENSENCRDFMGISAHFSEQQPINFTPITFGFVSYWTRECWESGNSLFDRNKALDTSWYSADEQLKTQSP